MIKVYCQKCGNCYYLWDNGKAEYYCTYCGHTITTNELVQFIHTTMQISQYSDIRDYKKNSIGARWTCKNCKHQWEATQDEFDACLENERKKAVKQEAKDYPDHPEIQDGIHFKDNGVRRDFGTGAVRDAAVGKGRFDLLQLRALWEVAHVMETGAAKYDARNWEKGIPLHAYVDSCLRHLSKFMLGHVDEPHLPMACWNILCCLDTVIRIKEGKLPETLNTLPIPVSQILVFNEPPGKPVESVEPLTDSCVPASPVSRDKITDPDEHWDYS